MNIVAIDMFLYFQDHLELDLQLYQHNLSLAKLPF